VFAGELALAIGWACLIVLLWQRGGLVLGCFGSRGGDLYRHAQKSCYGVNAEGKSAPHQRDKDGFIAGPTQVQQFSDESTFVAQIQTAANELDRGIVAQSNAVG